MTPVFQSRKGRTSLSDETLSNSWREQIPLKCEYLPIKFACHHIREDHNLDTHTV